MKKEKIMLKINRNQKGFTLIEVIVTMVLVGIATILGGMLIVSVANGYAFARMNANTVQKAELAMTLLTKEFNAIESVSASSGTGITYTRRDNTLSVVSKTISQSGGQLLLDGNPLTDRVSAFTLRYCNTPDLSPCPDQTWSSSSRIIEFTLTLTGANNTTSQFITRVAPRNL
jgi:prepilin-type N-terminal cleavage/methylation domain-containing protein